MFCLHIFRICLPFELEHYIVSRIVFPISLRNELAKPEVAKTPKWGSGLKCLPPKIGFRFNYNDQSVSCAWQQLLYIHQRTHHMKVRNPFKGPRTLQLKIQKKSLSSIHTTTLFHNCKDFFNSFIYGQQFPQQFFWKNRCEILCSVRGP